MSVDHEMFSNEELNHEDYLDIHHQEITLGHEATVTIYPPDATRQLQNGYKVRIGEVTEDMDKYYPREGISFRVDTPEGNPTGIEIDIFKQSSFEKSMGIPPMGIRWNRYPSTTQALDAVNDFFQATKKTGNTEDIELRTELQYGDTIGGGPTKNQVSQDFFERMFENSYGQRYSLTSKFEIEGYIRVGIQGKSGFINVTQERISLGPNLKYRVEIEKIKGAIKKVFEATTADVALIPIFDEAIELGFEEEEKRSYSFEATHVLVSKFA